MEAYSDEQSEGLLNAVATPLWVIVDGTIRFVNQAAIDQTSITLDQIIGQPIDRLIAVADQKQVRDWLQAETSNTPITVQLATEKNVQLTCTPTTYQGEHALMITVVDAPQLVNTERSSTQLELLERAIENMPTGILIVKAIPPDYPLIYVNQAGSSLSGVSIADLVGTNYQTATVHNDIDEQRQVFMDALETGEGYTLTQDWVDGEGIHWWADIDVSMLTLYDEPYMVGIIHDVTKQQLAQQAEREQRQLVQALLEAGSTLNRTLNTDKLLRQTVNILRQIIPHETTNIMLMDEHNAVIRLRDGYPDNYDAYAPDNRVPLSYPSLKYMIDTGTYCLIPDTEHPEQPELTLPTDRQRWIRSFLGVPIQTHDHMLGFINLGSQTPNYFDKSHADRLLAFAGHVAVALQNAWLYEQAQEEITDRKESERQFRLLAENLPDGVFILDSEQRATVYANHLEFLGYSPKELERREDFLRLVHPGDHFALQNFWQFVDQNPDGFHQIDLRIKHKETSKWEWIYNRQIALELGEKQKPQKRLHILTRITDFRETEYKLRTHNQELEAINTISLVLNSSLDLNQILPEVLAYLKVLVNYDAANLFFVEGDYLQHAIGRGFDDATIDRIQQTRIPIQPHLEDKIEQSGAGFLHDVSEDPRWVPVEGMEWIGSAMFLNLIHQGNLIAALSLYKRETTYFTQEHANKLTPLIQQIATAITNARLYEQAQTEIMERRRAEDTLMQTLIRTDALYQITRVLMLPQVIPELLDIVATILGKTLRCQSVAMMTLDIVHHQIIKRANWGVPILSKIEFNDIWHGKPGEAMRSHQPIFSEDDERGAKQLIVPIQERGFIFLENGLSKGKFTQSDEQLLMTIAGQLAVALENNALYAQLEDQVAERTSQLNLERQRLRAILDGTGEGVIYMEDFTIEYVNPAFCEIMGMKRSDIIGTEVAQYTVSSDPAFSSDMWFLSVRAMLLRKSVVRVEKPLFKGDGNPFQANMIFNRISKQGEEPFSVVVVVRDTSLEQELQAQKDRFLENAAHELRTPLTSFILRLHMLRRQPERISTHLSSMDGIADRMKQLVDDLVEINRLEQGRAAIKWQQVNLLELLNQAVKEREAIFSEKSIELRFKLPETDVMIQADWRYLQQAIGNLLTHALDYSSTDDSVDLELIANGQGISIVVRDYGDLIPEEYLPDHIFDPFARPNMGDQQGTGLGLTLARKVAQMHGGDVTAANNSDKSGNTFTLYLPMDSRHKLLS